MPIADPDDFDVPEDVSQEPSAPDGSRTREGTTKLPNVPMPKARPGRPQPLPPPVDDADR
ncbi:hypothetical protein [Micromonospora sp. NPDC049274]|uniref:hypothetical protein n=1 Tax=Micromonospora sp. NPDC049274 TaxID=3154829 RepID=UPI003434E694